MRGWPSGRSALGLRESIEPEKFAPWDSRRGCGEGRLEVVAVNRGIGDVEKKEGEPPLRGNVLSSFSKTP